MKETKELTTKNSKYRKEIDEFIKKGGSVEVLPDEEEWNILGEHQKYSTCHETAKPGIRDENFEP